MHRNRVVMTVIRSVRGQDQAILSTAYLHHTTANNVTKYNSVTCKLKEEKHGGFSTKETLTLLLADARTICDVLNYSIVFVELMNIIHCTESSSAEAEVLTVADLYSQ